MKSTLAEFPPKLTTKELIAVSLFIVFVYGFVFVGGLNNLLNAIVKLKDKQRVWMSEGGLWDHPEPNYSILPFVAELFASLTAMPLAGGVLLYQGLRFSYNTPVLILFLWDCWMYSCAFFSHMLLWPLLNSITLTSVLTNALYTFGVYGGLAGGFLKNSVFRWILAMAMWLLIVWLVCVLPAWFGENGGVPALLTIQTPAVVSALLGAKYCSSLNRPAFRLLTISGVLLCSAMSVSLIEVVWGRACQPFFGPVPVFHVVIHILEQIGIYLYGVGVAAIEHVLVRPVARTTNARIEHVSGWVPYFAITCDLRKSKDDSELSPEPTARRSARLRLKE